MKWLFLTISLFLFSCSVKNKETDNSANENKSDTMEIIREFIYGLWSMDSGNILMNQGYYFKADGSVDFVAAGVTGEWKLVSRDSIRISYSSQAYREELSSTSRIDSLSNERMVLSDSDGTVIFRKVPYGVNNEGTVLQGFAGTMLKGEEREYNFNVPSAKKIQLKLQSENPDVTFQVYDGNNLITSVPVREWTAIMIKGGKYRLTIALPEKSKSKDDGKFDLKVISF